MDGNIAPHLYSQSIFGNSLITTKILSFLSLSDIKNFRLVSKSWSHQGLPSLRKLSFMKTNLVTLIPYMKLMEEDTEIFVHSNFTICHDTNYADSAQRKETILRFFKILEERRSCNVRFLRVIMGSSDLEFLRRVLCLMPNLNTLEIIVGSNAKVQENGDEEIKNCESNLTKLKTSSLKTVAFMFANVANKQAEQLIGPVFATFFPNDSTPWKLEKVEILDKSKNSVIGGNVMNRINQWKLRTLTNIQLVYSGAGALKQLALNHSSLTILKVGVVSWSDLALLRTALGKHSGTLSVLEVEVSTKTTLSPNTRCTKPSTFDMPTLPRLRKLVYAVGKLPVHLLSGSRWCGSGMTKHYEALAILEDLSFLDYMNLSQIIEGGQVGFSKKFPSLTHLELKLCGGYNRFHDIFFSNIRKNVEIPQIKMFFMELPNWGSKGQFDSLVGRISKIFPNVDYPRFDVEIGHSCR